MPGFARSAPSPVTAQKGGYFRSTPITSWAALSSLKPFLGRMLLSSRMCCVLSGSRLALPRPAANLRLLIEFDITQTQCAGGCAHDAHLHSLVHHGSNNVIHFIRQANDMKMLSIPDDIQKIPVEVNRAENADELLFRGL